jgi:hypothetical protein
VTRVRAQFGIPGQFVWHCHIVEHEDNEVMRPYRVGPPVEPAALQKARTRGFPWTSAQSLFFVSCCSAKIDNSAGVASPARRDISNFDPDVSRGSGWCGCFSLMKLITRLNVGTLREESVIAELNRNHTRPGGEEGPPGALHPCDSGEYAISRFYQ